MNQRLRLVKFLVKANRRNAKLTKGLQGFVLMEALFAIFLICIGAFIVAATMPISNVSRQEAQLADKAMDLAQKEMEAIRAGGFSSANATQLASEGLISSATPNANTTNTYSFSSCDAAHLDDPAMILPNGAGTVTITSLNINETQIVVTVTWTNSGNPQTYSVGTVEANL